MSAGKRRAGTLTNTDAAICSFIVPFLLFGGQGASEDPQAAEVRAACDEIHMAVLSIPGTAVDRSEGAFYDDYIERDLNGCMIIVSGVWSELTGRSNPGDSIYKLLSDQGWVQEPRYSADGPDGTFFALSNGDVWCFVRGQWDGGDDADSTYIPSDVYQFVICCARFKEIDPGEDESE